MSLIISNLTKIYGTQRAVDDISFEVKEGEILGLLGPNGAGKSTTMKIVTGFIPPSAGNVKVYDFDVVENPMEVKKITGYLPESNPLYYDMYVHEFLHFIGSLHGLSGKKLSDRVAEMVDLCGLTIEQKKKIGTLSKGYKQRVGLAQALIQDPKVLILDEPTSGLDPNQILEIRKLITTISKNKTVIFSSHIMQEVKAICDKVVIINRGKLVYNDTVSNIEKISNGKVIIHITFNAAIDTNKFKIDGVLSIENVAENAFKIETTKGNDLRAEFFKISTLNNYVILEQKIEESSLEEIFHQLTN
jgi:ABC-2 type transport system ATP-binding protein